MKSARVSIGAVLVLGVAVVGVPTVATAKSFTVNPPGPIQTVINSASAGDTINVMPGDYNLEPGAPAAITINKSLKLIAKSKLPGVKVRILPNPAVSGQIHGIFVEGASATNPIDGFTIQGFTVEGFQNMGIWLKYVTNYTIVGNESINNLENGIFPTLSPNGVVKKNLAYGSQDSALWVEGSQNVRVIKNELATSPTGLEITISNGITVEKNNVHDNTIGVGLYNPATAGLPQSEWPTFTGTNAGYGFYQITGNHVHHNNFPNTAPGGSETSQLPYGGGILALGVQNVDVQKNLVERNDFFGIALVDYCLVVIGTPFDCTIDPPPVPPLGSPTNADFVQVVKNKLVDNHAFPPAGPFQSFAADILELGNGPNDCYSKNAIQNSSALSPALTSPDPLTPACP